MNPKIDESFFELVNKSFFLEDTKNIKIPLHQSSTYTLTNDSNRLVVDMVNL